MKTRMQRCASRVRRGQAGMSIIELMVGVVVALLLGLAATGSALMFNAAQRQGMGAGGAVVNANTALAALKNDTASAGLGFFGDSRFLCNKLNLSVNASVLADAADFAPVRITHADSGDTVDVIYGTRVESGANVLLGAASDGSSAETLSLLPVSVGQAVLVAPDVPGNPCVVRSVTAVTAATDTTRQQLVFANAGKHNAAAFSAAMSFPEKGRVALLGELRWNRYRLNNGNLVLERPLEGNASAVLARNVVAFHAQYGVSANVANSTTLEGWQEATGTDFGSLDGDAIARVRALRLGLVTRSPAKEKPNSNGQCEASSAKPQLFGAEVEPDVDDWQCWRFRTSVVVVPLRNLVMGVKP